MASVSRTIGLAALVAAAPGAAARAQSVPQGSYQADVLGRVELSAEHERLVAYASDGGPCRFKPQSRVLEGQLKGGVLVGQLTLCLQGASCPAVDTLPILALYSPEDRSLTAYVRPRAGCLAPVLGAAGLLVLNPAQAVSEQAPVRNGTSAVARLRTEKRNAGAAKAALERGNRLLGAKEWSGSAAEFEQSITHDDRNWVAFFGLGTAWLMRGQTADAIDALTRARALNPRESSIHYNLACAYSRLGDKKQALANLGQAVKLGFAITEGSQDQELDRLLGSDAASLTTYMGLIQQAVANNKASAGRRQQTGP
ncbi:TPR end-of-group domain-containing protein [Archangium lansingense]|uniref:Tetratricopeptide repeat protein n=1 Tax=Archangium lansingense TaxID=2995310 RepID=A0ABT4A5W5_9BACT|nr:tetratricopeptide repeat protein [Archangium lansinium]MCY1076976.1 tetratricopeptide repeat protein [Archangium lansinium]